MPRFFLSILILCFFCAVARADGPTKDFDKDGKLLSEREFHNGLEDGVSRWYYPSGKLKSEIHFKAGVPEGAARWYAEDGKENAAGNFTAGEFRSARATGVSIEAASSESFPWGVLLCLVVMSVLPLPFFLRRWGSTADDSELHRLVRTRFFLFLGLALVVGGVAGMLLTSRGEIAMGHLFFAISFLLLAWGTGFSTLAMLAREKHSPVERWAPERGSPLAMAAESGRSGVRPRLQLITQEMLVIAVPELAAKFRSDLALNSCLCFVIGVMGPILAWMSGQELNEMMLLPGNMVWWVPTLVFGGPALALGLLMRSLHRIRRERDLCMGSHGRELVVGPEGIRCSLGLVDGEAKKRTIAARESSLLIPWERVKSFGVEPPLALGIASPAYYKIQLEKEHETVFIRRRYFYGNEEKILRAAKEFLDCPILLNDKVH